MSDWKINRTSSAPVASVWHPFRYPVFRWLWVSAVVANVGAWMYNAAAGWLMTSLDANPLMVSLVQVATSLLMFPFALPAGTMADIIDRRRLILILEICITGRCSPVCSIGLDQLGGPQHIAAVHVSDRDIRSARSTAWQAVVPHAVPKEELDSAVAANSIVINISRAIGPALAGVIIATFGMAAPFWLVAISNFGLILVFWRWRSQEGPAHGLPAERVTGAMRTGFRHARNNRHLRATLARSAGFFLFASAYWALLPRVARERIAGGPELYGILLGAIGFGAMVGAFALRN
jgi:MFS family permease